MPTLDLPRIHPVLGKVAAALRGTAWESDLFLVGGAVRDALLGNVASDDFDLVTQGDAGALVQFLYEAGLADHYPVTYEQFGTAMLSIDGVAVEFITARAESYRGESRKPTVEPADYMQDALRRDFTVNSLRADLFTGEAVDTLGTGLPDMQNRLLRTPKDPRTTFAEDPLRMLRAVRFRWKLGFSPAPGLYEAIAEESHRLEIISAERIRDELNKILMLRSASLAFQDLMSLGLLDRMLPEFRTMIGVTQGHYHDADVWGHTLKVLDNSAVAGDSLVVRWAALLHDVAKPVTRTVEEDGRIRFFNHEVIGAQMSLEMLRRLKFSERDAVAVSHLVRGHMRIGSAPTFSASAARRLWREYGEAVDDLLRLVEADANGLKAGVRHLDLGPVRAQLAVVSQATPPDQLQSPLTGGQIMEITGLSAGSEIGKWKAWLTELVLNGDLAVGDESGARERLVAALKTE